MAKNVYSPEELEKYYRLRELRKKREAKEKAEEEKPKAGPKEKKKAKKPEKVFYRDELKGLKEEEWPDWARVEKRKHRYWLKYNHKNVKITLLNNMELIGKLHIDFTVPFDVQLEVDNGKRLLIPKHAIAVIEEL